MIKREFEHKGFTFKRVNKKTALKAFKNGLAVVLSPVNLNPFSMWYNGYTLIPDGHTKKANCYEDDFHNWVNRFEAYNCTCNETGKYTAFYIPVKYVDAFTGEAITSNTTNIVQEYDYSYMKRRV